MHLSISQNHPSANRSHDCYFFEASLNNTNFMLQMSTEQQETSFERIYFNNGIFASLHRFYIKNKKLLIFAHNSFYLI